MVALSVSGGPLDSESGDVSDYFACFLPTGLPHPILMPGPGLTGICLLLLFFVLLCLVDVPARPAVLDRD